MATVLLEARSYRPFKSSEEYLYAMREDLAEWLNTMYPDLMINVDNFMDRLDTGVALCKHANNVRKAAEEYIVRRQARNKCMTRSMTTGLAGPILTMGSVPYLSMAKCGTFFARDNVSNFIAWCRKSLQIFECLLFETDDLIMRKNEKHVILCLLEVARRGAKFGMLAPMLVQMERQIDREIAADNKAMGISIGCGTDNDNQKNSISVGTDGNDMFDSDSDDEEENNDPMMIYGPQPQIITNDLKSLDEMVRDLVEKCTCPSQFAMIRISEGKYRIGDTKVLIFVRILRSHVMVRVGGGWDTLSHYLDKHDPCRCKAQHRSSVAAKLITRTNNQTNGIELHKAQVVYERSPPLTRKQAMGQQNTSNPVNNYNLLNSNLSPPVRQKSRSRSPTQQTRYQNNNDFIQNEKEKPNHLLSSPSLGRRSASPSPRRINEFKKKQYSLDSNTSTSSTTSNLCNVTPHIIDKFDIIDNNKIENTNIEVNGKSDNISDNGSEISDEGYRSLGLIQNKRTSLHSEASNDDVDRNENEHATSTESPASEISLKTTDLSSPDTIDYSITKEELIIQPKEIKEPEVEQFSDIASATGLRKTGFSDKIYETDGVVRKPVTKIPRSPIPARRKSIDNSSVNEEKPSGLPLSRKMPVYRSVRKLTPCENIESTISNKTNKKDGNSTWSGRPAKTRSSLSPSTFHNPSTQTNNFSRNTSTRASLSNLNEKTNKKVKSASATTSPVKKLYQPQTTTSPLAKEILQVAGNYKNDTQILEKMKEILNKYKKVKTPEATTPEYEDFTTAWVNSSGSLDMAGAISNKPFTKRTSTISSNDSSNDKEGTLVVSPRRDRRGCSKIPAPVRTIPEIYS